MAANHIDNGYLILRNIRIPRENMLMKHAQVRQTIIHLCQYSTTPSILHYVNTVPLHWNILVEG
jgi:hypothetical protein